MSDFIECGDKVRLKEDLTRYHKALLIGSLGIAEAYGSGGLWAHGQPDRFVSVVFEKAGRWDILRRGLEIVEKCKKS